MWTPEDRALVGDYGSGQALSDDQYRLLEPLIPPAKPGGRPRATDMRQLLDSLFYLLRTGCQWRHLPPPPAFLPRPSCRPKGQTMAGSGIPPCDQPTHFTPQVLQGGLSDGKTTALNSPG